MGVDDGLCSLHYEKFQDGTVKCIEDEIPFDVPEGWAWCRLQNFSSMSNGTSRRSGKCGIATTVLRLADLTDNSISYSNSRSVILSEDEVQKYALSTGDILFIRVNGNKENVGRSYYFRAKPFQVAYCDHLIRCTPLPVLDGRLLAEFMRCTYVRELIQERMVSAAGQNTISQPSLGTLLLPIPPLNEQNRIMQKFENVDTFIMQISNARQELSEIIKYTKAKILDLAIRGKLVPQDPNDEPASVLLERILAEKEELIKQGKIKRDKKESAIFRGEDNSYYEKVGDTVTNIDDEVSFELPDSWTWCRGFSVFAGMEVKKPSGDFFRYIDIDSINNKRHTVSAPKTLYTKGAPSRASRAVREGSVVFSLVRPYLENIAFIDANLANCIASTGFYVCTSNGALCPEYMFYLMTSDYVIDGLNQYMKGDNSPSISKENIEDWLYPVPPYSEQIAIAEQIRKMQCSIQMIEDNLS